MSESRRVLIVDAFAEEPLSGNPAGVVPEADGLSDEQMRAVAREVNASETAFVLPSTTADRRIRYFAPDREVELCGHATIAAHYHLFADGSIDAGTHGLETDAGVVEVTVEEEGIVWMAQGTPEVREADVSSDRVAATLGIDPDRLLDDLPVAWASTGRPFLVVPIEFLEDLGSADPDVDALGDLASEYDVRGIYAFTFDALDRDSTLHGRMFAPGAGRDGEDPVTGTASGAVGGYLRHVGAFDEVPDEMVFEQGHYVDRPGRVRVRVETGVRVGGRAVTALDGEIGVPEWDEDEIIEV